MRNRRVTMGGSTYYVFYWVSVNGDHADGGCPFVVLLVNVLIQEWEVNKPKQRKQRRRERRVT